MKYFMLTYNPVYDAMEQCLALPPFNLPKTRASKILQFKHYQTDAPV
ncbi:MAG: hypothetical protein WCT77_10625 [Bacteroidota bacterium]